MKQRNLALGVVGVAAVAYAVHGLVTGTGLVGWLNALQQDLFGAYSLKVSAIVVIFGLMVAGVGAWSLLMRATGRGDDGAMARLMFGARAVPDRPRPVSARLLWRVCLGLVLATWIFGYAAMRWMAAEQRADAQASYEPVLLVDGAPLPHPQGRHLRLQGRLLSDQVLTHRSGSGGSAREDYQLVPVAAPGWRPGQAVGYVIQVQHLQLLPGQRPAPLRLMGEPPAAADALLARVDGAVPVAAAQAFRQQGVMLAPDAQLLHWVPSRGDRPDVHASPAEDLQVFLWIAGGVSVLLLLVFGLTTWLVARQQSASLHSG